MAVYRGVPWRFIFTDLGTVTTTWADGLLTNRNVAQVLDQSAVFTCNVWPDDKRVNTLFEGDGYPLVAQSNRLIYGFRREAPPPIDDVPQPPWKCRFGGILMSPEDEADADVPLSTLTAYDPWTYLGGRACVDIAGQLPGPQGLFFPGATGDQIALQLLLNTITNEAAVGGIGNGTFIDAGPDWGGTSFWGATPGVPSVLETTPAINFSIQQGTSVADAWTQLCNAGNLDIVLRPIYDPQNRPGYTHELSIYNLAGAERPDAIFGWDMMRRNLKRIDRMHDATPGSMFNKAIYFTSQGGIPVPPGGPLTNADSLAAFGTYWAQQSFPNLTSTDPTGNFILALMTQAMTMVKQGKRTLTMDPIPERSPVPLTDYELGDRVPVYASKNLRVTSAGFQRVQGIPIQISDDGIETIASLLTSPDWRVPIL